MTTSIELVKDLAARFKTRIEMRQIGVRDETKLIGGIGICGREVCCRTFLTGFVPVSIKMAKKQELVLNTSKLSGLCGRLMCCLAYESEEELRMAVSAESIEEKDDIVVADDEYKEEAPVVKTGDSREPKEDKKERVVAPERPGEKRKEEVTRKPEEKGPEETKDKEKEAPRAEDSEKTADDEKKRRRSRKFHRSRKRRKKKK